MPVMHIQVQQQHLVISKNYSTIEVFEKVSTIRKVESVHFGSMSLCVHYSMLSHKIGNI